MKNSENITTIVAFHIGRGGRHYNQGFLSFIGEKRIDQFTSDLFLNPKNLNDFKDHENFDEASEKGQCILDLASNEDYQSLLNLYGISKEEIGEMWWFDNNGNSKISYADANSGIGKIDLDGEYDTTYTCYIEDCDQEELELIMKSNYSNSLVQQAEELFSEN